LQLINIIIIIIIITLCVFLIRSRAAFGAHLTPLHFIHPVMTPHSHCDTLTR